MSCEDRDIRSSEYRRCVGTLINPSCSSLLCRLSTVCHSSCVLISLKAHLKICVNSHKHVYSSGDVRHVSRVCMRRSRTPSENNTPRLKTNITPHRIRIRERFDVHRPFFFVSRFLRCDPFTTATRYNASSDCRHSTAAASSIAF